jgi:N-acetylmuramoyl-L-alanine amidase
MAFKVALNAGHYLGTLGKNCPKSLDPNMTKEWVLNNRVVTKMQNLLSAYEDIEVLRVDDPTGRTQQSFTEKRKIVNDWGADFYEGVHHNALGRTFDGGGISAFVTIDPTAESVEWRDALYYEAVKETGLKGNRADPLVERDLKELRCLNCPAVLMECGFMDSTVDCPQVLTEEYADKIAKAFVAVNVEKSGAKIKSAAEPQKTPTETAKTVTINLPILKCGSRGEAVRSLQTILNAKGALLEADGSFGPATDKALREFQESRDLDIDGFCGAETWTALLTKE